jgi:hypothetical protein
MDNFLNSLPKSILVGGALAVGLVIIFLIKPPHTKCDSQFEIFQKAETPFLYKDPTKKFMEETQVQTSMNACKQTNSPGSCFQFFEGLKFLIKDIQTISYDCRPGILSKSEISTALWQSLEFIFEIAWGKNPPANYLDKLGWLDNVHVSVFCDLQALMKESFSEDEWTTFREKMLAGLPGAQALGRKEVWNRSLFTLKCQ